MSAAINRQYLLKSYPEQALGTDNFEYVENSVPVPGEGEFVVRNTLISLDPAMRGWASPVRSYIEPVKLGDVMRAICGGTVVASRNADFSVGAQVTGLFGLQDYAVSNGTGVRLALNGVSLEAMMGPVGITGLTAYFGLFDVGAAKPGETVLVSAAAGAVGSAVVQMAHHHGCRRQGTHRSPLERARIVSGRSH